MTKAAAAAPVPVPQPPADGMPPDTGGGVRGVAHYETEPDSITWHKIWDHEVEGMLNISRPIVLGLSTMFLGASVGLLPSVRDAFAHVGKTTMSDWDLVFLVLAAGCFAAGVVCAIFAVRGQLDARETLERIRSRNPHQINQPQGGGVPGISATGGAA